MTSVHCSKVATVYEEEKPPSRVKEMEREIIRYSSPIQPWYVPERQPLSLQLSSFLRSRERRASLPRPPDALLTSSSSFLSSSSSSSSVFLSLYPYIERKCSINLITVFFYREERKVGVINQMLGERKNFALMSSQIICTIGWFQYMFLIFLIITISKFEDRSNLSRRVIQSIFEFER